MKFITFEGIDGSGKSTLLKNIAEHLRSLGKDIETTREPGGTPLGNQLRNLLLKTSGVVPCPQTELLIYEADRAQHVETKIKPLLQQGTWVLSDRFTDSSLAFQGAGRKIAKEHVAWLNNFATSGLEPDLTFLVDTPYEIARQRLRGEHDRIELELRDFHENVRQEFISIAEANPKRVFIVDGSKQPPELLNQAVQELGKRGWL